MDAIAHLQFALYQLEQWSTRLVDMQLNHLSPLSIGIVLLAGLLTSLTPCMLSMLPITIGYIGAYEVTSRAEGAWRSLWFALGLATTLAGLGLFAAGVGRVYGQIGWGLPLLISGLSIAMGLNLLGLLPVQLPSLAQWNVRAPGLPTAARPYLLGLSFGLVASPCTTPVLAALLGWISTTGNPLLGGSLLLAYGVGYVMPLVVAGTFTVTAKRFLELRQWSGWITPACGTLLIGFGVLTILVRLMPVVPA